MASQSAGVNTLRERRTFYNRKQQIHETLEEFADEIRRLAKSCQFGNLAGSLVRDRILFGLKDLQMSMTIVDQGGDPSSDEIIDLCRLTFDGDSNDEQLSAIMMDMTPPDDVGFEQIVIKNEPVVDVDNEVPFHEDEDLHHVSIKYELAEDQFTIEGLDPFEDSQNTNMEQTCGNVQSLPTNIDSASGSLDKRKCPVCRQVLKRGLSFLTHIRQHPKCHLCGRYFRKPEYLKMHNKFVHRGLTANKTKSSSTKNANDRSCDLCYEVFASHHDLEEHMRDHFTKQWHKCDICGKVMTSSLSQHKLIHFGGPFQCRVCGRRFTRRNNCRAHERLHESGSVPVANGQRRQKQTGQFNGTKTVAETEYSEPPDVENEQPSAYVSRGASASDLLKFDHFGNEIDDERSVQRPKIRKTRECDICGKVMTSSLKQHKTIHFGQKPFQCRVCDKRFNRESNCRAHERLHEKGSVRLAKRKSRQKQTGQFEDGDDDVEIVGETTAQQAMNLNLRQNESGTSSTVETAGASGTCAKRTCPICKIDFTDDLSFCVHLSEEHPKCYLCGKYFRAEQFLRMHLTTIHNKIEPNPTSHKCM